MKKKWLWNIFWLALVAVLLYAIFKDIDFRDVYTILTVIDPVYITLAVVVTGLTFFVWAIRWTFVSGKLFKGDFWFLLNVLLAGAFFNSITGGAGVGGEPFRAHFLAKRYKRSMTQMLAYVLADKFYQLIVLAVFTIFSVFFVFVYVDISNTLKYVLEGVLVFVVLFSGITIYLTLRRLNFNLGVFFKKLHFFNFIKKRFKKEEQFEAFLNNRIKIFARVFRRSVKNRKVMFEALLLSVFYWFFFYLATYFLFLAFDFQINFLSLIIVVTLGNLIGSLAMVPGGVGIVEISMTLLFSAMGVFFPLAFLVSLLTRLVYYVFSLPIGALSLWYVRKVTNEPSQKTTLAK